MEMTKSESGLEVELEQFMEVFPEIVEKITGSFEGNTNLIIRVEQLIRYTVPNGKNIRSLIVPAVYKILEKEENLTLENKKLSYIMGWLVEISHAGALLFDDIVDGSETRRGIPCWHTKKEIGLTAVNDGLLLIEACFYLLGEYFADHVHILSIYRLLHMTEWKTVSGQLFECTFTKDGKPDLTLFTIENYRSLVRHKSTYYTFCSPVSLAMYLANISDKKLHKTAENILLTVGEIFQIQNDLFDYYGGVENSQKRGEDIREGRCTWLAVKALEKADSHQRKVIEEHYGSKHPESIEIICNLYEELGLVKLYSEYKIEFFDKIQVLIQQSSEELPPQLFSPILAKLYERF